MSSQLLPFTATPPPPPQPPVFLPKAPSPSILHTLSQRVYIPSHVYKHPSAILLELCTSMKELHQILPLIIKNGLLRDELLFQTKLVSLFCNYGSLTDAARVFEPIEDKLDVLYHTLLKGYTKSESLDAALSFFCRMRRDSVRPIVYNFTYLLKVCGDKADLRRGKEIHGQLITSGFSSNLFAMTSVVNMYAKCRMIHEAYKMFDRMPVRDLVSWNTIIAGYAQNGLAKVALELVIRLFEEGQRPDSVTIVSILPAAADMGSLVIGRSVHGYIIKAGFESFVNVLTALVDMYAKCGAVRTARSIFEGMNERTVVSWNSMIDGYVQSGDPEEAMKLFQKMLDEGMEPTNVTVMEALHACADLGDLDRGIFVHKLLDELKLESDISVANSLISMYSKCKRVDIADGIFKNLQRKTLVSWNAMILGYAQNGCVNEALSLFCEMQSQNVKRDSFSLVSVIPALADLSVTRQAKWIHGLVIRSYFDKNVYVMTALVDMYAKCGAVQTARKLFDMMDHRHVTTWNAMIDGYGTHGFGEAGLDLFREMQNCAIKPNTVTFLCVLSACSHSGLVEEGLYYFNSMKEDYGLEPLMDHYGAMVDLLGRAGRLNEAWNFIQEMPFEPGINVYGAMLGACKIHRNVELGEKAADKIFELNPHDGGYHVLLANIYATASMWHKVAKVRTMMEKNGLQKTPGCSLVELRNEVHTFYSGSTEHPQSKDIYAFLEKLVDKIKASGYVPDTNSIHDVEDNVKEQLLNSHSERLAIAFGLLNTSPGTTIHIRKNLRVCGDCHTATKYISLVTGREIIVRDMQRFHHFKNGECSCGDYW
ncbi:pentatricopeptide repeat-containing protein [Tripterygium wilfordii]|uniref:Pentatricopeptide repeat-containing protein n=1 Tax=Tripterygium wilfordii TaxID=458696 RepID=A0A7J7C677_TRIWF|nr:pentatricopeptide repeat-containing protein At1g11290, chloroplastic [Tripterygium wilfordii]KAF5729347.1 pentatricopeptide repeat-containing protein [Tripterygium wilfordii]